MYHDTCDPSIISCQFFPVYHIPKMSDKKLFRQIFNFYKKKTNKRIQTFSQKPDFSLHKTNSKKINWSR